MRKFKRQRGYITIAQKTGKINYLRMAYGLALSLKATQSEVPHLSVAVLPGTKVPKKYREVFDEVVEIPWGDSAFRKLWKIQNKWKIYHITPYEETVLLDADMVFPTDVSHWWDLMSTRKVWAATQPRTYRNEIIHDSHYRNWFKLNNLPMVYSAFMYFQRGDEVEEMFNYARTQVDQWGKIRDYYYYRDVRDEDMEAYKSNPRFRYGWTHDFKRFPPFVSGDLMFAMAMKAMGVEKEWAPDLSIPSFVHMKMQDQGLVDRVYEEDWTRVLPWSLKDDMTVTVSNYVQRYPFHYCMKGWLDADNIRKLERAARRA